MSQNPGLDDCYLTREVVRRTCNTFWVHPTVNLCANRCDRQLNQFYNTVPYSKQLGANVPLQT